MIYFDNAATGGFKPRAVTDSAENVIRYLSANPGRSGHRLSVTGAEMVYGCRKLIGEFVNATPEKVIFTKNCTEALNMAIFGTLKVGGHVITTVFEHNSVLRPLTALSKKGLITLDIVSPSHNKSLLKSIEEKIRPETYLITMTGLSNVTGESFPLKEVGALAKSHDALFLVDGAQAGGHIPLDIKSMNISLLALAGHKGLYGIMGSGVLVIDDDVDVMPLIYGGTGSESFNLNQPESYPERLESGTLNLPAITALLEGVRYVKNNTSNFGNTLYSYTGLLTDALSEIPSVKCYSTPNRAGIVSFEIKNIPSSDVADILSTEYDVAVRGGLHCSPLIHKYLKTETNGLVRVSLSVQNSTREIHYFIRAIKEIAQG